MNEKKMFEKYKISNQENRYQKSKANKIEFLTTIKYLDKFIDKEKDILEIGCGTGFYPLHFANKAKSILGVDIIEHHICDFQKKLKELKIENVEAKVADAINLMGIADSSYDIVCSLGPMYHLDKQNRELALKECVRVCKPGGIIFIAYINKIAAFIRRSFLEKYKGTYPNKKMLKNYIIDETDDKQVFEFSTPKAMEELVDKFNLLRLHNIGVDGVVLHHKERFNSFNEEELNIWMKFHEMTCEDTNIIGLSDHGLLICKKQL